MLIISSLKLECPLVRFSGFSIELVLSECCSMIGEFDLLDFETRCLDNLLARPRPNLEHLFARRPVVSLGIFGAEE